jgi:hypothetical protein
MMKQILSLVGASLLLGSSKVFAAATEAGAAELSLLNMLFKGPLGFALGLGVVVMGILEFFVNGDRRGLLIIFLGVLITLTPGVYNAATNLFVPMVCALWSLSCSG